MGDDSRTHISIDQPEVLAAHLEDFLTPNRHPLTTSERWLVAHASPAGQRLHTVPELRTDSCSVLYDGEGLPVLFCEEATSPGGPVRGSCWVV